MYFNLFSNCFFVRGASRGLIVDAQRNHYFLVPNGMQEILALTTAVGVEETLNRLETDKEIAEEYIRFLHENELGLYYTENEKGSFPPMNLEWESPFKIANVIVDVDEPMEIEYYYRVNEEFTELGVYALQIRFYNDVDTATIINILKAFSENRLRHIDIAIKYSTKTLPTEIKSLFETDRRLAFVMYHSSPFEKRESVEEINKDVIYIEREFSSDKCCGVVHYNLFTPNLSHFTESQRFNTCLNRKVSIDPSGNIRNCPSLPDRYGNIRETKLSEAILSSGFTKYWKITKDQVLVCKDCEFRNICTDCRAFREDAEDIYSKPLKCGYDPYSGEWEEWSNNPLKMEAIKYYGLSPA